MAAGFTGRGGDVEAMLGMLDPRGPGGTVVVSAVAGMAGVGKTELVLQFADPGLELLDELTERAILGLKVDVACHAG